MGKRNKVRQVLVNPRTHDAQTLRWRDRGVEHTGEGLLLVPAEADTWPRVRAKVAAGRLGYSDRGVRKLVERAAEEFKVYVEQAHPDLLTQSPPASTRLLPRVRYALGRSGCAGRRHAELFGARLTGDHGTLQQGRHSPASARDRQAARAIGGVGQPRKRTPQFHASKVVGTGALHYRERTGPYPKTLDFGGRKRSCSATLPASSCR